MYPRLKYIWKYMEKKDNTGLQIKETLDDARAKSELLEHGCLSMAVFYYAEERAAQQEQRDQRARRSGRGSRTSGDQAGVR